MSPMDVLFYRIARGGYKEVAKVETHDELTNKLLARFLFFRPRRENGTFSEEARASVVYEALFTQALTSPEGEDTAKHLGGIVPLLGYEGPRSLEELAEHKGEPAFRVMAGTPIAPLLIRLDNHKKITVALDVSYTLARLHKWGIVHGDVKPDNIIDFKGVAKLCDLGFAGIYDPEKLPKHIQEKLDNMSFRMGGTLVYTAPELLEGFGSDFDFEDSSSTFSDSNPAHSYSERADLGGESSQIYSDSLSCQIRSSSSSSYLEINQSTLPPQAEVYSFGVTLYELISGELPFIEDETIMDQILQGPIPIAYHEMTLDYALHKIALECMNKNETQRPRMAQVHHRIAGVAEKFGMEIPIYNPTFID